MEITTKSLSHLGIIAGTVEELGIGNVINNLLPKNRAHNIDCATAITAMCINGLGFTESRLCMYPSYFENVPTERLLGEGVLPEHLNDDVLGRTLDKIYDFGPTELFNEIVIQAMKNTSISMDFLHTDTTNFSLHGNYNTVDPDFNSIDITYGHPKDMRRDLKRFVLSVVSNGDGIPLFAEALSGNASDKHTLIDTIMKIQDNLKLDEKVYHIADSAIYSGNNVTELGMRTLWITRVPANINEAKDLLNTDEDLTLCEDTRYSYYETTSSYGGIEQKWVLLQSKEMKKRTEKTFDKKIEKNLIAAQKSLSKLTNIEYACETDAKRAAEAWIAKHKNYQFKTLSTEAKSHRANGKRGRPKRDEVLETYYSIVAEIETDETMIAKMREKQGRFILATNDLDLTPNEILSHYKNQGHVERGFRFLKDKSFHVSEVYLKKESRIEALAMIMVLCLFLYSIAQLKVRNKLKETGTYVKNQVNKPIQNPTMKWIFFLFRGISEAKFCIDGKTEVQVTNMTDELWDILDLLGTNCKKYYL